MDLAIALLTGLVLGVVTSIPVGPVAGMVVQLAVNHDRRAAILCGAGCATVDAAYSLAASLGVGRALETLPSVIPAMYVVGGLVLVALGLHTIRAARLLPPVSTAKAMPPRRRAYFTGLVLSATNPVPLMAWIGLSGTVLPNLPPRGVPFFSVGVLVGVLSWFAFLTEVTVRGRGVLGDRRQVVSNVVGGLLLISAVGCLVRAALALRVF